MKAVHKRTLERIFANPVSGSIKWREIESLFAALGAEISEGSGSRVLVEIRNNRAVFHLPHPSPDTDKGAVRAVRRFLNESGFKP